MNIESLNRTKRFDSGRGIGLFLASDELDS